MNKIKTNNSHTIRIGHTDITYYREERRDDPIRENRFICSDLFGLTDDLDIPCGEIIMVCTIVTDKDRRGEGSARCAMNIFGEMFKNNIIAVQSGPLCSEYPEEPEEPEYSRALARNAKFLEAVGFRSTNIIHGFEQSIGYVYRNKISKPIIDYCIEREIIPEHLGGE